MVNEAPQTQQYHRGQLEETGADVGDWMAQQADMLRDLLQEQEPFLSPNQAFKGKGRRYLIRLSKPEASSAHLYSEMLSIHQMQREPNGTGPSSLSGRSRRNITVSHTYSKA